MISVLLISGTAFLISLFAVPSVITVAKLIGLYDQPFGRKQHASRIPRMGGIAIYTAFTLCTLLFIEEEWVPAFRFMQASLFLLFFAGLKDDIIILSPWNKLGIQLAAATLVVFGQHIHLNSAFGLLGINQIPSIISAPLSILIIIGITNSINLIDGIDGLATGLGIIASFVFGIWFYLHNDLGFACINFALFGSLVAFILFNFAPAKIFMGDAGALVLGFILACSFIHLLQSAPATIHFQSNIIWFAMSVLIVPIFDTLRVIVLRLIKGKSLFVGDRLHIHFALLRIGMSHKQIAISLYATTLLFISVSYFLLDYEFGFSSAILLTLIFCLGQLPFYFYRHLIADIEAETTPHVDELLKEESDK